MTEKSIKRSKQTIPIITKVSLKIWIIGKLILFVNILVSLLTFLSNEEEFLTEYAEKDISLNFFNIRPEIKTCKFALKLLWKKTKYTRTINFIKKVKNTKKIKLLDF